MTVIVLFLIISFQIYENFPREPIDLAKDVYINESPILLNYGNTPVFSKNLRFNHNEISYFIETSCQEEKVKRMIRAFDIFEETFEIISFFPSQKEFSDIKVICSEELIDIGGNLFEVGEGGPSIIINTSQFKIIEEGKISLYKETSKCNYPVVELHELIHVFGFDHTLNPKSIMYNVSGCDQRITPDMVKIIKDLYSIPPLPDLKIKKLSAMKKGRYLDFNITILNEGLTNSPEVRLSLINKGKEIERFDFEEIQVGHGRTIRATNIRLPSLRVETINFVIDNNNLIEEFNENNNLIRMKVKS